MGELGPQACRLLRTGRLSLSLELPPAFYRLPPTAPRRFTIRGSLTEGERLKAKGQGLNSYSELRDLTMNREDRAA